MFSESKDFLMKVDFHDNAGSLIDKFEGTICAFGATTCNALEQPHAMPGATTCNAWSNHMQCLEQPHAMPGATT
jgi:hypothetical protein